MNTEDKRGDIHKNYFCSTAGMSDCPEKGNCVSCPDCHRKWPTPEMFFQEYGKDYPYEWAVWFCIPGDDSFNNWTLMVYEDALKHEYELEKAGFQAPSFIVCACTPWGKPPEDWERV